jgi:magnesium-transporting ATPase (P-type)
MGIRDLTTRSTRPITILPASHSNAIEPPDCEHATFERDLVFLRLVALEDPPKADVPEATAKLRTDGIRVIMVTGDHPRTACAIGREIGLVQTLGAAFAFVAVPLPIVLAVITLVVLYLASAEGMKRLATPRLHRHRWRSAELRDFCFWPIAEVSISSADVCSRG